MVKAFLKQIHEWYDHEISLFSAVAFLILMGKLGVMSMSACWRGARRVWSRSSARAASRDSSSPDRERFSKTQAVMTLILLLIATEMPTLWIHDEASSSDGLFALIQGTDPRLDQILERVPAIRKGPRAPWLFRNRHIQFIPWLLQNEWHRQRGIPFQRIRVPVTDCHSKMAVDGCHRVMNDTITLDVFPPLDDEGSAWNQQEDFTFNRSSPVIFFSPGLRCHSQDLPGNMVIRKAYEQGFRSVVVHRRGHTPQQKLQSPRWNLFGDVGDLEQVYWFVRQKLVAPHTALFLHGISSGTAVTVTALSKWDRRRRRQDDTAPVFVASIAVTPGYDISKVLSRDRFLFPYNDLLLGGVKDHFVKQNEELLRSHNSTAVDEALQATNLQEFVDASVAFAGYDDPTAYYQDTNPINEVRDITTPKLVLNALDDPCCSIQNLFDTGIHPHHEGKTYAEMIAETQNAMVAVTRTGSHCPFLCTRGRWFPLARDPLTGGWMLHSWADQVSIDFYRASLDVYGDRRFL